MQNCIKSILYTLLSFFTTLNFTIFSLSLDINYNPRLISTGNNLSLSVIDPKVDETLNKDLNISIKDISLDQDQATIKKLFLKIRDKTI